ncbi:coiled-coil domain-containing protein 38 [Ctenodactylus gundi]
MDLDLMDENYLLSVPGHLNFVSGDFISGIKVFEDNWGGVDSKFAEVFLENMIMDTIQNDSTQNGKPYRIFFKDLFLFKENELAAKNKEKALNRGAKVYQKSTFSSRMKSRSHLSKIALLSDQGLDSVGSFGLDPKFILRLTQGFGRSRTIHEFISDQRDRFLLEYSLSTKRSTIVNLDKLLSVKEGQLKVAEKKLQNDAMAFEEFLRENDQQSVDALKMAAQETITKVQIIAELKKASMDVQAVKSEIAKTEFLLREYMKYGLFLLKLTPKHWQVQQTLNKSGSLKSDLTLPKLLAKFSQSSAKRQSLTAESEQTLQAFDYSSRTLIQGKPRKKLTLNPEPEIATSNRPESVSSEDSLEFFLDDDMDLDLQPQLYFKDPEELLQVFTDLEEQNLTLVQYAQDVDENLEEVNKREKVIRDKINANIDFLLEQKAILKANCQREEEKAAELELRSRLFNFGEFNSDAQEKLINSLTTKINQVYTVCIGDADVGSLNAVQKLVKVESRLVELSDMVDSLPKDYVDAVERLKQKERWQKMREEKMKEKQKYQEERLRTALERAVSQPKKKVGRRHIFRSTPPSNKAEITLVSDPRKKSLEEDHFFS